MSLIEIIRNGGLYHEAHKAYIHQTFHKDRGWESTVRNANPKEMPELTLHRLVQLKLTGHSFVSLWIQDNEGYPLAQCSDYKIEEFTRHFKGKSLTTKHPSDNRYITLEV
jgi:hypothetical protein